MKKQIIVLLLMVTGFFSFANDAKVNSTAIDSAANKFLGVWDMVWRDLPDGDMNCQLVLKNVDGKLQGEIDSEEIKAKYGESINIYDIEIDGEELSFMYTAEGYDVSIIVELVEGNKFEGYMMDMFEVAGVKASESK